MPLTLIDQGTWRVVDGSVISTNGINLTENNLADPVFCADGSHVDLNANDADGPTDHTAALSGGLANALCVLTGPNNELLVFAISGAVNTGPYDCFRLTGVQYLAGAYAPAIDDLVNVKFYAAEAE